MVLTKSIIDWIPSIDNDVKIIRISYHHQLENDTFLTLSFYKNFIKDSLYAFGFNHRCNFQLMKSILNTR